MDENFNGGEKNKRKIAIHTYRDLAIEALDNNPTSLAKMVLREKEKRKIEEKRTIKNPKNLFLLITSVVLGVLGVLSVTAVILFFYHQKEEINIRKYNKALISIFNDYKFKKIVYVSNVEDIENAIESENKEPLTIPYGTIKNLFFITNDGEDKRQLTSKEFLGPDFLDTKAPNQFIRDLKDPFSIGYVSLGDRKWYLMLGTNNPEVANISLYAWEKNLVYDIGYLFGVNEKYYNYKFSDLVLYNHDTRAILNDSGEIVFAYSIIDTNKIIFFTDVRTFKIILESFQSYIKE